MSDSQMVVMMVVAVVLAMVAAYFRGKRRKYQDLWDKCVFAVNPSAWRHVALSQDGGETRAYVNGSRVIDQSYNGKHGTLHNFTLANAWNSPNGMEFNGTSNVVKIGNLVIGNSVGCYPDGTIKREVTE